MIPKPKGAGGKAVLIFISVFLARLVMGAEPPVAPGPGEGWLFEQYQAGNIDTINAILDRIPDSSAAGMFFRGVFQSDGEAARFYYDQVVALYPGSQAEGWALAKLWQYHYAKGDNDKARRYWKFLNERHPNHPSITFTPDFAFLKGAQDAGDVDMLPKATPEASVWTVQVGAFGNKSGAEAVAKKVKKYGAVRLVTRDSSGQKLTAVLIGKFTSTEDALRLADKIKGECGLDGRVMAVEK